MIVGICSLCKGDVDICMDPDYGIIKENARCLKCGATSDPSFFGLMVIPMKPNHKKEALESMDLGGQNDDLKEKVAELQMENDALLRRLEARERIAESRLGEIVSSLERVRSILSKADKDSELKAGIVLDCTSTGMGLSLLAEDSEVEPCPHCGQDL